MEISESQLTLNEDIKYLLNLNLSNRLENRKVSLNALYATHFINNEVLKIFSDLFDLTKFNDPSLRLFNMENILSDYKNLFYYNHLKSYNKTSDHLKHNIMISQILYNELINNNQEFRQAILEDHIMTLFNVFLKDDIKYKLKFESHYNEDSHEDKYILIINDDELSTYEKQDLVIAINLFNIYYNQKNKIKSKEVRLEYKFNELKYLSQMDKLKIYLKSTLQDNKKSDTNDNLIGYERELSLQYQ